MGTAIRQSLSLPENQIVGRFDLNGRAAKMQESIMVYERSCPLSETPGPKRLAWWIRKIEKLKKTA